MPRVDYDRIAHLYDEPMRRHRADEQLLAFLDQRPDLDPSTVRILDVGCGTGTQLAANRERLPRTTMVGVDPFKGMLRIAGQRDTDVGWVQGDGAHLPFASGSIDYATNQFSYQHIGEREAFVHEVHRVLRARGRFVMMNIDPWTMPEWSIYRFFPETRELDLHDFLPTDQFVALMHEAGFESVDVRRLTVRRDTSLAAFLDYASERHRTSQFMAISDAAYAAGLERIRAAINAAGATPVEVDSGVSLVIISGNRGPER